MKTSCSLQYVRIDCCYQLFKGAIDRHCGSFVWGRVVGGARHQYDISEP